MGVQLKNAQFTTSYIGRYAKRPAMAESRIKDYDGQFVTFEYQDKTEKIHNTITLPVKEFITRLIRHIPDKNFRQIRYYGLYANRSRGNNLLIARTVLCLAKGKPIKILDWRYRRMLQNGYDPLICCHCKAELKLVKITYPTRAGPSQEISFE